MRVYRCNLVRPNKSVASVETFLCGDDAEAMRKAQALLVQSDCLFDVEVWQQARRVHPFRSRQP
jgi:predicted dinucleotide-binding enzyme